MKIWFTSILLLVACLGIYWPHQHAEFILDDYYTVVRNPLIKNPTLYKDIWKSRLFDAHQSSGYIKFGYYRPVLESSWALDYRLFGLNASGYQWLNLCIHLTNCLLIYLLFLSIFGSSHLSLKTSLLFCVLPAQEWVVRYVTGRGDELSAMFALMALNALIWVFKSGKKSGYFIVGIAWVLAALTREVAISYIMYALLIYYFSSIKKVSEKSSNDQGINQFCFWWVLIGILPFILIWSIIPKQGNVLVLHVLYFTAAGFCLWIAQWRLRWVIVLIGIFASISFYQGRFWTTEESLLRHTRNLEIWPRTVVSQQLLMKYDDDILGITDLIDHATEPKIKAMWLRRLGLVYFNHQDLNKAEKFFTQSIMVNPTDVDDLNALAVVYHVKGQEAVSLNILNRALAINPNYPDTLRTIGIHYYNQKDYPNAQKFLKKSLIFDPNNTQAQEILMRVGSDLVSDRK